MDRRQMIWTNIIVGVLVVVGVFLGVGFLSCQVIRLEDAVQKHKGVR